jgi:hypothetical protein
MDDWPVHFSPRRQVSEHAPGDHLLPFPGEGWAVWRWVGLRSAGFPISHVLQLAVPDCTAAADLFLAREGEVEQAQRRALDMLSDEIEDAEGDERMPLFKVLRLVKHGKQPPSLPSTLSCALRVHLETLQAAYSRRGQAYAELQLQFARATEQSIQVLCKVARMERFREAVMWQNRRAVRDGIELFVNRATESNPTGRQRRQGELIAKYAQRYCTKNDTIGFFGPMGWGRWTADGVALAVHPGARLLAARTVYFETWAIDILCEVLARDKALLPWAIPRPMPFLYLAGTALHVPFSPPLQLSGAQAVVLAACDGQKTAREVAQVVLRIPRPGLAREADVFALLDQLRNAHRIIWTFEVSAEEWHPERALRRQLERITSEALRQEALQALEQLESARTAVAEASGNVERLDQALEQLETTFTNLTRRAATREEGKTYAARTLVYEDCRRDVKLTLGPALLQELGCPLALLLTSARWFTYTAGRSYLQAFQETYRKLSQKAGSSTVDFATFWSWVQPLVPMEPGQGLPTTLIPEFQKRWAALLDISPGQHRVHYTSQELQSRVQESFASPCAGWPSACYHSPDIMLDATSTQAVLRGEYQLVLGEFHLGINTLDTVALAAVHPILSDLLRSIEADLPEPRVLPLFPRNVSPAKRTYPAFALPKDWRLIFSVDSGGELVGQALPIGLLVLEDREGELVVRTRDGRRQFGLLEIFSSILSLQICNAFKLLAPAPHTPRVTIDRLVVCRETWRFAPAELFWAFGTDALEGFVGIRRWAHALEMPRHLFVRIPCEKKPYYIDLDSPVYTEMFARAVRQAHATDTQGELIAVTEMLPDPDHIWLPDADGNRYTSEMRVVVVDQHKSLL